MSNKKQTNIKLDGIEYAVGLDWIECSKGENLKYIHKRELKLRGDNVVTYEADNNIIIGYAAESQLDKTSLACATALYERDCLYVYKIDSLNRFWLNYVAPDGRLGSSMSDVLLEASDVIDIISQLLIIISSDPSNKLRIYSNADSIKELQDTLTDDLKLSIFGDNRILIQSFDIQSISTGKFGSISRINKVTKGRSISTLGLLALSIGLVVSGAGGYAVMSGEPEAYENLTSSVFSSSVSKKEAEFKKLIDGKERSIFNSFNLNRSAKELVNLVESNIYTFDEIINDLDLIANAFPIYLVEWQNNKVAFIKDDDLKIKYQVPYNRIKDSFGVYNEVEYEIKEIINDIDKDYKEYIIKPTDSGKNSLVVDIEFKKPFILDNTYDIDSAKLKYTNDIKKTDGEIKKLISGIKSIETQAFDLGFFSKRFTSKLDELVNEAESLSKKAIGKIKDKEKIHNTTFKVNEIKIPEDYYSLNRDLFLDLMQKNNHYNWTLSEKSLTIPKIIKVESVSKKTKSKSSKKSKTVVEVALEPLVREIGYSWDSTVSSKVGNTIGIDGLRKLKELINNKSITIKSIEYNFNTQNWVLNGEFYEKK